MFNKFLCLVCIFIALLIARYEKNSIKNTYKTVETKYGAVRGLVKETLLNRKPYLSFRGIPFAKPPIGELRFKAPVPPDPWTPNTINAFEYSKACSQIKYLISDTESSEDCLYLNVFVPVTNKADSLPVMFYIFGGAFVGESGDDYSSGPDFLMEREVILVTFNHRVNVFGFMSLGTPEYSGNMGLKDQQLAIKWTYENIEYFGGDNTRITLAGQSSGSMSVTHHMLNERSTEYFTRTLAMSGTALSIYRFVEGDHRCLISKFARRHNESIVDDVEDLIQFMKNVSEEDVMDFVTEVDAQHDAFNVVWMPIIEDKNAIQPFLIENPIEKWQNTRSINLTSYFTFDSREMLFKIRPEYLDDASMSEFLNNFYVKIPLHGYDLSISKKPYLKDLMNELRDFVFANATNTFDRADRRIILDSDFEYVYFIDKWVQKQAAISQKKIFYHQFSVDSTLRLTDKTIPFPGASHADDVCYLFWCRFRTDEYKRMIESRDTDSLSEINFRTIDYMNTLVSNFVKYGKPAVERNPVKGFEPVRVNEMNFLNITKDGLFVGKGPNDERMKFYDYFIAEAKRLVEAHGDEPKGTVIQRFCDNFITKE